MEAADTTKEEQEAAPSQASREPPGPSPASSIFISKHRLRASISCLEYQINLILDELEDLKATGSSSSVCS
ncbi:hypothetical protein Dimus_010902, partial [Dionaea muscipula]